MIRGQVTGVVWTNRQVSGLRGQKLVLVSELDQGVATGRVIVAIDTLDAEAGAQVVVGFGSAARNAIQPGPNRHVLADAAIIQRIDGSSDPGPAARNVECL